MKQLTVDEATKEILAYQQITFLTGAGVSTPSGVPDYRSLSGIYHGMEATGILAESSNNGE